MIQWDINSTNTYTEIFDFQIFVAIYTWNNIFIKSGPNRCRNRSVNNLLFMRHINGRPVYNAIYAEHTTETTQNIVVTAHREWCTCVDTQFGATIIIQNFR